MCGYIISLSLFMPPFYPCWGEGAGIGTVTTSRSLQCQWSRDVAIHRCIAVYRYFEAAIRIGTQTVPYRDTLTWKTWYTRTNCNCLIHFLWVLTLPSVGILIEAHHRILTQKLRLRPKTLKWEVAYNTDRMKYYSLDTKPNHGCKKNQYWYSKLLNKLT